MTEKQLTIRIKINQPEEGNQADFDSYNEVEQNEKGPISIIRVGTAALFLLLITASIIYIFIPSENTSNILPEKLTENLHQQKSENKPVNIPNKNITKNKQSKAPISETAINKVDNNKATGKAITGKVITEKAIKEKAITEKSETSTSEINEKQAQKEKSNIKTSTAKTTTTEKLKASQKPIAVNIKLENKIQILNAQLTSAISKLKPKKDLGNKITVTKKEKVKQIYFYCEIKGMKGQTITHRWTQKTTVRAEIKSKIASDFQKTYSSKKITKNMTGNWKVDILDSMGNIIHSIDFKVVN